MEKKFTCFLIFILALISNISVAQEQKHPLIMKVFEIKTDKAEAYRFPRENSQVIDSKKAGSKVLVVKEKDNNWLMVQIGGVNCYMRKDAVELNPENAEYKGSSIVCYYALPSVYLAGRWFPTGYRNRNIYLISNSNYRYNSMR